jgi:hypothetical protein
MHGIVLFSVARLKYNIKKCSPESSASLRRRSLRFFFFWARRKTTGVDGGASRAIGEFTADAGGGFFATGGGGHVLGMAPSLAAMTRVNSSSRHRFSRPASMLFASILRLVRIQGESHFCNKNVSSFFILAPAKNRHSINSMASLLKRFNVSHDQEKCSFSCSV